MKSRILFVVCLITCLSGVSLSVSSQTSPPNRDLNRLQVGVLRIDGTLVPFAEYRNNIWWNPWPEITENDPETVPIPKSLSGHPSPWFESCLITNCTWYFWPSIDDRRILSSRKVVRVENHMDKNWAFLTDMADAVAEKDGGHHKNIGVAINADLRLEGMKVIDVSSKEAAVAVAFLKTAFIHLENKYVDKNLASPADKEYYEKTDFPVSRAERSKVNLELQKLNRTSVTINGRHLYYFEIQRKYLRPEGKPDWQCYHLSELSGWLLRDKNVSFNLTNESFWITNCDRKGGGSLEMFSILRIDNRTFLLTVDHLYDNDAYVIYELEEFGLKRLLETSG